MKLTNGPVLQVVLNELQMVENFLMAVPDIDMEQSLQGYMNKLPGLKPQYLTDEIRLKHTCSVSLLVKYQQACGLMLYNQVCVRGSIYILEHILNTLVAPIII